MKTASAGLAAHLAQSSTTLATCWKCTLTSGTVKAFTDHDQDLVFGGLTYIAASGYTRSAIESSNAFAVDNLEVEGALVSPAITRADLLAGLWDYALIEIFQVNWADLTQGALKLRKGHLGEVRAGPQAFSAELRGLMQAYSRKIGELYQPACRASLGDTRCKVRLQPAAWAATTAYTVRSAGDANTGSVVRPTTENGRHFKCTTAGTSGASEPSWNTTIGGTTNDGSVVWTALQALTVTGTVDAIDATNRVITDAARAEAAGLFDGGKLTFTSGANAGLAMEVKTYTVGSITLHLPMAYTIVAGDAYSVHAGCLKRFADDCQTKFDNAYNYRGEPHLPGLDQLLRPGGT